MKQLICLIVFNLISLQFASELFSGVFKANLCPTDFGDICTVHPVESMNKGNPNAMCRHGKDGEEIKTRYNDTCIDKIFLPAMQKALEY